MKRVFIYSLLSLYVIIQIRPLAAVLQDAAAHTFFKMQHLATIHYENGRYHLHAELKTITEEDKSSADGRSLPFQKASESASPHITQRFDLQFNSSSSPVQGHFMAQQALVSAFISVHSPPPKA